MRALFRYLFLKHLREGWLYGFILGPALLVLAPYVLYLTLQLVRGRFVWPLRTGRNFLEGFKAFPEVVAIICGVAATVAAFYAFARESSSRSIGSIILAARPRVIVLSTALFATVGSLVAYAVAYIILMAIRSTFEGADAVAPAIDPAALALQAALVFAACASTGVAMMSISPIPTMMIPAYAITLWTVAWQQEHFYRNGAVVAIAQIVLMLTAAVWLTRRRCAA